MNATLRAAGGAWQGAVAEFSLYSGGPQRQQQQFLPDDGSVPGDLAGTYVPSQFQLLCAAEVWRRWQRGAQGLCGTTVQACNRQLFPCHALLPPYPPALHRMLALTGRPRRQRGGSCWMLCWVERAAAPISASGEAPSMPRASPLLHSCLHCVAASPACIASPPALPALRRRLPCLHCIAAGVVMHTIHVLTLRTA